MERRGKPKKKENFLRKAKRHGRKGDYGRGKRLSEEEYSYYMKVFEQLKHLEGEEKGEWLYLCCVQNSFTFHLVSLDVICCHSLSYIFLITFLYCYFI